ncbi:MAG: molybdopterin synthase sulfur carrier subunit [Acidimicrobiia bacterium]|nr:molybdopterin synthase sulfur carrier subunit [Acidimicrobiia bacterium]
MPVSVRIPTVLRPHASGASVVEAGGPTVGDVVGELVSRFPGMSGHLTDGAGQLQRFVNVYVNDEDIRYLEKLATPVKEGDEVAILPAVAGGAD